ncbi:hypothetical protein B7494_g8261 [Chlorociboria aeruginascens]|nr:hypothetical protein B7494_g8261 [Chlorociboria aeruginascens]
MKFTSPLLLVSTLLLTSVSGEGIFAITGSGTVGSPTSVTLEVQNGNVGDAPTCSGTVETAGLPASGTIPCAAGYALSFTWETEDGPISATYTTSQSTFTYNVPNNGCDGDTCQFGFTDLFPPKMRRFVA